MPKCVKPTYAELEEMYKQLIKDNVALRAQLEQLLPAGQPQDKK